MPFHASPSRPACSAWRRHDPVNLVARHADLVGLFDRFRPAATLAELAALHASGVIEPVKT